MRNALTSSASTTLRQTPSLLASTYTTLLLGVYLGLWPMDWSLPTVLLQTSIALVMVTLYATVLALAHSVRLEVCLSPVITIVTVAYHALLQPPHRSLAAAQQPDLSQAIAPTADCGMALAVLKGLRLHLAQPDDAMDALSQWFELRNGQPAGWNAIVTSCCQQLTRHAEQVRLPCC